MRHASLESGLGGFDLAADVLGWENVFHVEINKFCQRILNYYWPDADSYADIFEFDGKPYRGRVDAISCGFPCQPFSLAGKGKGDQDNRFIWPENMRIIREVQPAIVVAENVPGLLRKHPMVFERVCTDLESEGYEVTPIGVPSCATEKDHIRERLFFVAYNHSYGHRNFNRPGQDTSQAGENKGNENQWEWNRDEFRGDHTEAPNDNSQGLPFGIQRDFRETRRTNAAYQRRELSGAFTEDRSWIEVAAQLCRVDDGLSDRLDLKAISEKSWRKRSIQAFGNCVDWQVASKSSKQ